MPSAAPAAPAVPSAGRGGPSSLSDPRVRRGVVAAVVVVVLVLMGLSTKVVGINSTIGAAPGKFSAASWARTHYPRISRAISDRAVPAATLASALAADPAAAASKYAVSTSGQPVYSVSFTGTVGAGQDGVYPVKVDGTPPALLIRLQTGPAINGTDIRDATKQVSFSQFTNQIDFQDAGSALNARMKQQVLSKVDPSSLVGRTVSVTGAFTLINPNGWLVTPVAVKAS